MKTVSKKLFSILLVAILLVSAVPFQAFADNYCTDPTHAGTTIVAKQNGDHVYVCEEATCPEYGKMISGSSHSSADDTYTDTDEVPATCTLTGTTAKREYSCGLVVGGEEIVINAENHVKDDRTTSAINANGVCVKCGVDTTPNPTPDPDPTPDTYTVKFVNGNTTTEVVLNKDAKLSSGQIPAVTAPANSTFHYWQIEGGAYDGQQISTNVAYNVNLVVKPYITGNTYDLTLYYVLNGKDSTATKIGTYKVPVNTGLLQYLYLNVNDDVTTVLNNNFADKYEWKAGAYWKNYTGKNDAVSDSAIMNQNWVIYVNFTPIEYTVYFNTMRADAKISTTSKKVAFNSALGTLPAPTCDGNVFIEWQDASGKKYDKDSVLNVANASHTLELYAQWKEEALVILKIYMNGNTTTPDRLVALDQYIDGKNVDRATVEKIIKEKYTAQSGKTLALDGLFIDSTWASYVANSSKEGERTVPVDINKHPNNIYVMVRNAQYNNGTSSSKPADSSNPKTGDNTAIFAAASVMTLTAVAFISMEQLRKKKAF